MLSCLTLMALIILCAACKSSKSIEAVAHQQLSSVTSMKIQLADTLFALEPLSPANLIYPQPAEQNHQVPADKKSASIFKPEIYPVCPRLIPVAARHVTITGVATDSTDNRLYQKVEQSTPDKSPTNESSYIVIWVLVIAFWTFVCFQRLRNGRPQ